MKKKLQAFMLMGRVLLATVAPAFAVVGGGGGSDQRSGGK
jgi:hypothetical protein